MVNATVGQEYVLTVVTSDQDGDVVTLTLDSALPDGATFANGVYTWTPANMDAMNITYVVNETLFHVNNNTEQNNCLNYFSAETFTAL